jgi:hypothetical protein
MDKGLTETIEFMHQDDGWACTPDPVGMVDGGMGMIILREPF